MSSSGDDLIARIAIIKDKINIKAVTNDSMKRILYTCINNFDYKFYKKGYPDLKNIEDGDLMKHYIITGRKEKRLTSKEFFDKVYPGFDVDYYRKTNVNIKNISNMSDEEIMCHYYSKGVFMRLPAKFNS